MASDSGFSNDERRAVYRAIYERRDVRSYLPNPIADEVLLRVLEAAHRAPSVGFMQPWNFLLIRSNEIRQHIYAHFLDVNARAAQVWENDRRRTYQALKLQGILDAPLNLLITCDTTRGGEHVLGRFTMPETDLYSTCLAVQNLWLAARAEGLGVGWMSIMEKSEIQRILGIPEHVVPVAYLTIGYPVEFAREPLLSEVGWRKRLPLDELIYSDRWGAPAQLAAGSEDTAAPRVPDKPNRAAPLTPPSSAIQRNDDLTKPRGSLGVIEQLALQLAGLQQTPYPRCEGSHLAIFAGDHGITRHGVSAYKPDTTLKMVYSYLAGGAVVNALARDQSLPVHIVDVGVDHDFAAAAGLIHAKVRRGTRDFTVEPAMSSEECAAAHRAGRSFVDRISALDVLLLGEMGIGNSTSAAALVASLLSLTPEQVAGPGTGIDSSGRQRKRDVIARGLSRHRGQDPTHLLAALGGFEMAALVGAIEAAAERRALIMLDGFITGAAALVAVRRTPSVRGFLVASHLSAEPAHRAVLADLELRPLLTLDMRLGEGSGAALAFSLVRGACRVMREVRTFAEANIERPEVG